MHYYNENNLEKAAWIEELIRGGYIPQGQVDKRSIVDVRASDLHEFVQCHFFAGIGGWALALKLAGWPEDKPVWTGSCPCQSFSSAGRKNAQSDERHLWPYFARLIEEYKPPIIFGEQVDEAITAGWLDDAFSDLEAQNYACAAAVLPAYSVGANFEGARLYFCAEAISQRLPGPWQCVKSEHQATDYFREADSFIHAFQGNALPYVCTRHDGVPARLAHIALHGAGDAIIPEIAAEFIRAYQQIEGIS